MCALRTATRVALALVVVGCRGAAPPVAETTRPPVKTPQPSPIVEPKPRLSVIGPNNVDRMERVRGISPVVKGVRFFADGTLAVTYEDEILIVGSDGQPRARLPMEGNASVVSSMQTEVATYVVNGKETAIVVSDAKGTEIERLDLGAKVAPYPALVHLSPKRVLWKPQRGIDVIDRASKKTISTLPDAPRLIDDGATRSADDAGFGRVVINHVDSATTTDARYVVSQDGHGWVGTSGLELAPDGRMVALQDERGTSIIELPSGRRTDFKGASLPKAPWGRDGRVLLRQGTALLSVDRADPKQVEKIPFPTHCPWARRCEPQLWTWRDVRWTKTGPVLTFTEWPHVVVWPVGQPFQHWHPGDRNNAEMTLSADARFLLDVSDETRVVRITPDGSPWPATVVDKQSRKVEFSPDSKRVVFWQSWGWELFDIESGKSIGKGTEPPLHARGDVKLSELDFEDDEITFLLARHWSQLTGHIAVSDHHAGPLAIHHALGHHRQVVVIETRTRKPVWTLTNGAFSDGMISLQGDRIASTLARNAGMVILDKKTEKETQWAEGDRIRTIGFSKDGNALFSQLDGTFRGWDGADKKWTATCERADIRASFVAAGGTRIATIGSKALCVIDAESGALVKRVELPNWHSSAIGLSADGAELWAYGHAGDVGSLRRFLTATGEERPPIVTNAGFADRRPNEPAYPVSYSPDGSRIVLAGIDAVITFDRQSGKEVARVAVDKPVAAVVSQNGLIAALADSVVRVIDASGAVRMSFPCSGPEVRWSSDGRALACVKHEMYGGPMLGELFVVPNP